MFNLFAKPPKRRRINSHQLSYEPLEQRLTMSAVAFDVHCTGVKAVSVNGQAIAGSSVGTDGIAYIEGSYDGSDNAGKNVTSRGATCNKLKTTSGLPTPTYSLTFTSAGDGKLRFVAQVGPVPRDFASMNVAFDFSKALTDRFAFNGTSLRSSGDPCIGLTGNRSSASYDDIRRVCTIPNTGGQKVGVAVTSNAPNWVEVSGTFGTARISLTSSSHYRNARFHNHPGADNVDLAFGRMRQGESARVEGEIVITPRNQTPNSGTLVFQAESQLHHQIGRRDGDGWSVNVRDTPNRYLSYGPYTTSVAAGRRTATFRLQLDNVTADNNRILTIDVYDADSGRILAIKSLHRRDFRNAFQYQDFDLNFNAIAGHRLEFRTYWHGGSYAKQDKVTIR